jgi:hypothetical protein
MLVMRPENPMSACIAMTPMPLREAALSSLNAEERTAHQDSKPTHHAVAMVRSEKEKKHGLGSGNLPN